MYNRPHHQRIAQLLEAFDAQLLVDTQCFFGGGTAIDDTPIKVEIVSEGQLSVECLDQMSMDKALWQEIPSIVRAQLELAPKTNI